MDYEKQLNSLIDSFGDWWNKGFSVPEMTSNLYPYTKMFSPIRINEITIKNRLIMAPIGNISMCEETGRPNEKMLSYFEERAKGGVGLITTGLVPVSFGIDKSLIELGDLSYFPRIDRSRTVLAGWRNLAAKCHAHGAKIFIQLSPGLGRVGNPQCLTNSFSFPRSSSLNPNWYIKDVPCLPFGDRALGKIIRRVGQGTADAKACNLDGVYLHGHEGYLLEQMTNTAYNRRTLGRYSDWMRFGVDMIKEMRKRVGSDFPIMYRIDLSLALNATYGKRMDTQSPLNKFKNERKVEETLEYMHELVKAGVDIFDVDLGSYDNWWLPHPPASMPAGCYTEIAEIAKKYFKQQNILSNKGLEVPIVGVGKLGYPDLAEKVLREDKCDMVMLGRPLLADAEWCNKAYSGKVKDIRPCIGCQEACINEFVEGGHPQCAVNPRTAFEHEFSAEIPKAATKKRVAVVGGGPAGIVAAKTLLARGHKVDLYEMTNTLGGSIVPGCKPIIKFDIKLYLDYLVHITEKLRENEDFSLFMNTKATEEMLAQKGYDTIVCALGTVQTTPPIEGKDLPFVYNSLQILNDPSLVKDAKDIVIIGGGLVGTELAYMLMYEYGKTVKIVEMQKYFMNHMCTANRGHIIHYLERGGAELLNCAKLVKIEAGKAIISQNKHRNVPNPYNTWSPILPENILNPMDALHKIKPQYEERELKADAVIFATGAKPNNQLYYECLQNRTAPEIFNVGDSFAPINVFRAVSGAYRKARSI
ncbi:MAG: FAD-dependent oxidoreductase [Clostridia bacterium]